MVGFPSDSWASCCNSSAVVVVVVLLVVVIVAEGTFGLVRAVVQWIVAVWYQRRCKQQVLQLRCTTVL